ncbi:MAG: hypothetical protein AAGF79_18620 [Pseudomonadota bacterium]
MSIQLLSASGHTSRTDASRPALDLAPNQAAGLHLALARVHEACGPARRTFALWLAGQMAGPVIWIAPDWESDRLHPDGMTAFADPSRFLFVTPKRTEDLLWSTEEVLRAGAVSLVVADLPGAPALTPVRRMHLAAEAARDTMGQSPLGLLLTPGQGGAQGVETRWHMAPTHRPAARSWHLTRARARTAPVCQWHVTRHKGQMHLEQTATAQHNAQGLKIAHGNGAQKS